MIADSAARLQALDVSQSFIVQAPAVSGKTELLIQRYLKLLETVETPDAVVAITFTRKAAGEMRSRVVSALRNARDGVEPEAEHELRLLGLRAMSWSTIGSWNGICCKIQPGCGSKPSMPCARPLRAACLGSQDSARCRRFWRRRMAYIARRRTTHSDIWRKETTR